MAQAKPIPVRLSEDVIMRLDRASEKLHVNNRAAVIKMCLTSFLDYVESRGYDHIPLKYDAILKEMDGRTHRYAIAAEEKSHYGNKKKKGQKK